jgi:hypothetical protein
MKIKAFLQFFLVVTLFVQAGQAQINDNFNDNSLNPSLWNVLTPSPGTPFTVSETNQRLEVTLGPGFGGAGIVSVAQFSGDFDVQVDYTLLNWPTGNLHSVRIGAPDLGSGQGGGVGLNRSSFPNGGTGEFYLMSLPNGAPQIATTELSGKLRLVRSSSALCGFIMSGTTWVLVGSGPISNAATHISLDLGAGSSSAQGGISVAFDNFRTNGGSLACPTTTTNEYAISIANNGDQNSGSLTHNTIVGNVIAATDTVLLACLPRSLDHTLDNAYEYIACTSPMNGDGIVILRTADDVVVGKIALSSPTVVSVRPTDNQLYVGQTGGQVTTIDITKQKNGSRTNTIVASRTVTLTGSVQALAFVNKGGTLAAGTDAGMTYAYNVVGSLPVFIASHQTVYSVQAVGLSWDSTKTYAFLSAAADATDKNGNSLPVGNVHIMDTATLNVQKTLMLSPTEITAAALVKKRYFYAPQIDGSLSAIDTASDTVVSSSAPGGVLVAEDIAGNRLFLADAQNNVVETINLGKMGPTSDQQGVSFGNLSADTTVVGVSVFSK